MKETKKSVCCGADMTENEGQCLCCGAYGREFERIEVDVPTYLKEQHQRGQLSDTEFKRKADESLRYLKKILQEKVIQNKARNGLPY